MEPKQLKVGDKIRVQNAFNDYVIEVFKVSKTMAFAKSENNPTMSIRLKINVFNGDHCRLVSEQRWSTTNYTLIS